MVLYGSSSHESSWIPKAIVAPPDYFRATKYQTARRCCELSSICLLLLFSMRNPRATQRRACACWTQPGNWSNLKDPICRWLCTSSHRHLATHPLIISSVPSTRLSRDVGGGPSYSIGTYPLVVVTQCYNDSCLTRGYVGPEQADPICRYPIAGFPESRARNLRENAVKPNMQQAVMCEQQDQGSSYLGRIRLYLSATYLF